MSSSEQLEHEAEQCRSQIAGSLAELRARMSPGEIVDHLVDYARASGGGQMVRNLQRQVIDNPLPLTLVGAGLAWLMMGRRADGGRHADADLARKADEAAGVAVRASELVSERASEASQHARRAAGELADAAQTTAREWSDGARSTGSSAGGQMQDSAAQLRDAASSTSGAVRQAASSAFGTAADTATRAAQGLRSTASSLRDSAAGTGHSLMERLQAQPMVLAGLGIAIGAAIGALLPGSDAEDRVMGEASDEMKERARTFAGEQVEKAKEVADRTYQAAKEGAEHTYEAAKEGAEHAYETATQEAHAAEGAAPVESPALVPSSDENARREGELPADAAAAGGSDPP